MESAKSQEDQNVQNTKHDIEKISDLIFKTQMIIANILPIIKPEDQKNINEFIQTLSRYEYIIKDRTRHKRVTFRIRK